MIEVLNSKKKRVGFIEGRKFFNKKHKLIGFLDGNIIKRENSIPIIKLDKHNNIIYGNEVVGFILDSKIYFREEPIFEFSKEKRKIHTFDGKEALTLIGNHEKINDLDFLAIATVFFKSKWWCIIYEYI